MTWCPHGIGDKYPSLFMLDCPWCRETLWLGDDREFPAGEASLLKEILATADTHIVQITAKCCGNPTIVLRHAPCESGCYDCSESSIETVAVSVDG